MPVGRVKWYSLEKGFGFISSDEGEDVYFPSSVLPAGVATVKPGTKLEFSVAEGRKGPQALSIHIIDEPASVVANSRINSDDLATMIEDTIKILDKVGNGIRHGRHPQGPDAERLAKVLRGIASQIEG
jgi:cold shock protein